MDRRSFFGRVLGAGAASAIVIPPKAQSWATDYRNYRLFFTGWKDCSSQQYLVGQWIANPIEEHGPILGINVPNMMGGVIGVGYVFDLSFFDGQVVTIATPSEQKAAYVAEGEQWLRGMIDLIQRYPHAGPTGFYRLSQREQWLALASRLNDIEPKPEYTFGFTGFKPPV